MLTDVKEHDANYFVMHFYAFIVNFTKSQLFTMLCSVFRVDHDWLKKKGLPDLPNK